MVKCADCGFLAARDINTRALDEVEKSVRDTGEPTLIRSLQAQAQRWNPDTPKNEKLLLCFKQQRDLIFMAQQSTPINIIKVIHEEIDCE